MESEARFARDIGELARVLGHADRALPLKDCCTDLLMPVERKSVEPMAATVAPARASAAQLDRLTQRLTLKPSSNPGQFSMEIQGQFSAEIVNHVPQTQEYGVRSFVYRARYPPRSTRFPSNCCRP